MKSVSGLHVIVGGPSFERTLELARIADSEGAAVLQLREKSLPDTELLRRAKEIRNIIRNAAFIVNDNPIIALESGADGVHLGQEDITIDKAQMLLGADAIIGVSAPAIELAIAAERSGANYIGFGHMFLTSSKLKFSPPQTLVALQSVITAVNIPVIAIGGITKDNLSQILVPGLAGIAVIGAIRDSSNPRNTIQNFIKTLKEHHAAFV